MRLHELARELDADSKRLLAIAKELGLGVKSHSSNLPRGTEGILRAAWTEELEEQAARAAKKAAKAAKEAGLAVVIGAEAEPAAASGDERELTLKVTIGGEREPVGVAAPESDDTTGEEPVVATDEPIEAEPVSAGVGAQGESGPEVELASDELADTEAAVADESAETTLVEEPSESTEPGTGQPADPTSVVVPAASDDEDEKQLVVTFGGRPAGGDAEEDVTDDGSVEAAADGSRSQPQAGEGRRRASEKNEVRAVGVPNVPTRRERKGAKILGKIEIKKKDAEPPASRRSTTPYDPLDPTRAMPERRGDTPGEHRRGQEAEGRATKTGRTARPGAGEFIFDPEDNSTLSAIRLGHFAGRRRSAPRRPPPRRSRMGGPRRAKKATARPTHPVTVRPPIGVRELSEELGIKAREILMCFSGQFDPRDKNTVLEADHLLELAAALDREITILDPDTAEGRLLDHERARADRLAEGDQPRPPVVVVMGHVDHGKTTLLDTLRKTRVAAKEAGGITQKTSAYSVETKSGAHVTFLDTPGHKAFTEMRARGTTCTDVAVLVVAADDGVMDQTAEAIDHANAAGVPMVVAINKIDRNNADATRVRQQLASAGVFVEDYGGEVGVIECSATTGQGLDELVERLALETELLELTADPKRPARGVVIDSRKDSKLGIVATVVVQNGTLRPKDALIAGKAVGRVRWLLDDRGGRVTEAGPSCPVQVVGFEEPPEAGARLMAVEDINMARAVVAERKEAERERPAAAVDAVTLENLFETIEAQAVTEVNVLLKADNMGSLDVLRQSVEDVSHPEVRFKVIRTAVGGVTEDDVLLASASKAFIIGFGVVPDTRARAAIQRTGVDVKFYDVIYEMADDLEKAIEGQLGTERVEEVIGHADVRAIFKASKLGNIAGCYVTDGIVTRDSHVRLVRDGTVVHSGRLDSLKRFKDDVKEVRENYECGIHLSNYNDIKEGDVLEAFTVTEVKRTLESTSPSKAG